jgi:hypothetical protein
MSGLWPQWNNIVAYEASGLAGANRHGDRFPAGIGDFSRRPRGHRPWPRF